MNKLLRNAGFTGMMLLASFGTYAQTAAAKETVPQGWHLLDKQNDGYYGIGVEKAYKELLKGRKSNTVIVAVIDSGIDTLHEDLKPILWKNAKEIPGNGIDDDGNGYIDDVHGWNFIGGKDGRNVKEDSYEAARVYHNLKLKFGSTEGKDTSAWASDPEYAMWQKVRGNIEGSGKESQMQVAFLKNAYSNFKKSDEVMKTAMGKQQYTGADLEKYEATTDEAKKARQTLLGIMKGNDMMDMTVDKFLEEFGNYLSGEEKKAEASNKAPRDYRGEIVKDNYADFNDRYYGNNDIMANTPFHGTHVSGIIGAKRGNNLGIDGVADNVRIMTIRAVPDGDEHDKDIALAIRYAVDNGARVINMSFGKSFSPEKFWVDDAVRYAESKGVLLVHAAGNDAKNVDVEDNFPNPNINVTKSRASNFITVGASGDPKSGGITASFSNYGKDQVDVFAPGVKIYSTIPGGNTYGNAQGTSMASPVVAGVAALILQYYPQLTGQQVKEIIEKSAVQPDIKVKTPGKGGEVELSELSRTGGLVNAYEAIKLADSMYGKSKSLPKSTMKSGKKQ
ncbi:S8 family peptidase [Parasegetibacter sp. NRK P23]|uniref:S8 family peptidase n=1 Tax=Parasegetibacter sp. NRK P23 TaxID=2942999 RepID=UPI0020448920|nr:S8 family peptidase [Parasegetibacter sp. NRK P23]MCM5528521.1 S8 family peptidase [Parasegetibacter sp. NRK P23]